MTGFCDGASYALLGLPNGDLFTHVIPSPAAHRGKPSVYVSHGMPRNSRSTAAAAGSSPSSSMPATAYATRSLKILIPDRVAREALEWFTL